MFELAVDTGNAMASDHSGMSSVDRLEEIYTAIVNNDYNQVSQVLLPELLSLLSSPADSCTSSWENGCI